MGCKAPNSALGDTQVSRGQYQNPALPSFTGHISDSLSSAASLENLVGGGRILRVNVEWYTTCKVRGVMHQTQQLGKITVAM